MGERLAKSRMGISIHAPAGGATAGCYFMNAKAGAISIHAPAGGATPHSLRKENSRIFQFTPLREGRQISVFTG